MVKKIFTLIITCLLFSSCYQPERDCKNYKTGSFKFTYELGEIVKEGEFTRDEKYSVDYYENKIDSATDSSYTFQYKSAVKNPNKELIVKTGTAFKIK